jgi:hypothetical protein
MGEKSTAVKRFTQYEIKHEGSLSTRVNETIFVDPAQPDVAVIQRDVFPPVPLTYIMIKLEV